jgi:flagellar motor switch/type III secretory pathway protein FliN
VVIRANGACVGHGRMVAVGETLAVQLLELEIRETR